MNICSLMLYIKKKKKSAPLGLQRKYVFCFSFLLLNIVCILLSFHVPYTAAQRYETHNLWSKWHCKLNPDGLIQVMVNKRKDLNATPIIQSFLLWTWINILLFILSITLFYPKTARPLSQKKYLIKCFQFSEKKISVAHTLFTAVWIF